MSQPGRVPSVGDEIAPFVRETGLHIWNRFAAVNDEYIPLHMDHEAGRAAGYPSAIGMGNLQWAFLHNLLREGFADGARIVRVSCQFRSPNLSGQTVTARGIVSSVTAADGHAVIELDVWTEADGEKLAVGAGTVELPLPVS